ncbi:MAG TPA: glycoside hydrolase family 57 [Phycisphaerae bacterium]|nr:glycoside hydrolase family 57 [Phycisphaerae bacterium]
MPSPAILFMPHGNLQYSQLPPEKRGWVAEQSYEAIFRTARKLGVKIAFEASGETLEIMAAQRPESIAMLRGLIDDGLIEPVASPHTHLMLSNVDPCLGLDTLINGRDAWEAHVGIRPVVGWNPECGWASHVPEIFREAGFETLIADADSYLLSAVAGLRETTGLRYDVRGHSNKNALFAIEDAIAARPDVLRKLFRPHRLDNGLKVILRSDMMCNVLLWYLMGTPEDAAREPISHDEMSGMLARWRDRVPSDGGFVMPYAEDAEYVGTTAYFYVKQFGQARFFEPAPESVGRFGDILATALELGFEPITPSQAVARFEAIPGEGFERIENGCAWHGGTAKAWANTTHARILDPVCRMCLDALRAVAAAAGIDELREHPTAKSVLRDIATAQVSDARWPPPPTSPGRFNVVEALDALDRAHSGLCRLMTETGQAGRNGLYSPGIMASQLAGIREELMAMDYFGE